MEVDYSILGRTCLYNVFYNAVDKLIGFQPQEDEMFELSIRATLEEAIDLAGISKTFNQDVGKIGKQRPEGYLR